MSKQSKDIDSIGAGLLAGIYHLLLQEIISF